MARTRIVIVGGGLAGLVASIHLQRAGLSCTVLERGQYPMHRVCGEYVSNEVVPYLASLGAYPEALKPSQIKRFQLTSTSGTPAMLTLDLGGFGISRYAFDYFLFRLAQQLGVNVQPETEVTKVTLEGEVFSVETSRDHVEADVVLGAYGKRSRLDKTIDRTFVSRHSPYVGVKYHVRCPEIPDDLIALHNFYGGYCGVSQVEDQTVNLCYLTHRDNVRAYGNLRAMEEGVLFRNPVLARIFDRSTFITEKPETINEISFQTKSPVDNHILMCGDAAGMIAPLCGNGMALAIHSAKIASEHVIRFSQDPAYSRAQLETDYARAWKKRFALRLWAGRKIQRLFGGGRASEMAVAMANHTKPIAYRLMKMTHGSPF